MGILIVLVSENVNKQTKRFLYRWNGTTSAVYEFICPVLVSLVCELLECS